MCIVKMFSTELKVLITSRGRVIYQIPRFRNDEISHTPSYWSYSETDGFRSVCRSELWESRGDESSHKSSTEQIQHKNQETTGLA